MRFVFVPVPVLVMRHFPVAVLAFGRAKPSAKELAPLAVVADWVMRVAPVGTEPVVVQAPARAHLVAPGSAGDLVASAGVAGGAAGASGITAGDALDAAEVS